MAALLGAAACGTTYAVGSEQPADGGTKADASQNSSSCPGKDLAVDRDNCGTCGNKCQSPPNAIGVACAASKCVPACASGFHPSDDGLACEPNGTCFGKDLTNDSNNCGKCGYVCAVPANGAAVSCLSGKCTPTCAEGFRPEGELCVANSTPCAGVDLQTDPSNCGTCRHVCQNDHPGQHVDPAFRGGTILCVSGECKMNCPSPYSSSGFANGCDCELVNGQQNCN